MKHNYKFKIQALYKILETVEEVIYKFIIIKILALFIEENIDFVNISFCIFN